MFTGGDSITTFYVCNSLRFAKFLPAASRSTAPSVKLAHHGMLKRVWVIPTHTAFKHDSVVVIGCRPCVVMLVTRYKLVL